ncbi:uncharacterized protein DS421_16g562590 [Arachis hypogaea]|nr:uncharacterized protein DS421_16g562590 [Arachis hypogaea]
MVRSATSSSEAPLPMVRSAAASSSAPPPLSSLVASSAPTKTTACEFRCGGFGGDLRTIAGLARSRSTFPTVAAPSTRAANVLGFPSRRRRPRCRFLPPRQPSCTVTLLARTSSTDTCSLLLLLCVLDSSLILEFLLLLSLILHLHNLNLKDDCL